MIQILAALLITQATGADALSSHNYEFLAGNEPFGPRYVVKPALVELGNGDMVSCYSASAFSDTIGHNTYLQRSPNRGLYWEPPTFLFDYGLNPDGGEAIDKGCGLSVVPGFQEQLIHTLTVKHAATGGAGGVGYGPYGERRSIPFQESFNFGYTWSATTTPIRTAEWASSGDESQITIVGNECWFVYYDQERGNSCEAIMFARAQRQTDGSCPIATAEYGATNAWYTEIIAQVCHANNHNNGWRMEEPVILQDPYNVLLDYHVIFRNSHFLDGVFVDGSCYVASLPKSPSNSRWNTQPAAGPVAVPNPWLSVSSPVGRRPAEFNFDACTSTAPIEADSIAAPGACRPRRLFPCSSAPKGTVLPDGMVVIATGDPTDGGRGVLYSSMDMELWERTPYQQSSEEEQVGSAFLQVLPGAFFLLDVQETINNSNTAFRLRHIGASELVP